MVWPLVLSFVTIGYSLANKSNRDAITVPATDIVCAGENRLFCTGIVLGLGFSLLFSTLSSYFRLTEHTRILWLYLTNTDEGKELFPYRFPKSVAFANEFVEQSKDGSVRLLLSSNTAATRSLNVHLLTLGADCEIPPRIAPGVEFYYVVAGSGSFSQKGVLETQLVGPGDCFVVDVGNMRWIRSCRTATEPLVLLRSSDGGCSYTSGYQDGIRLDPNHKATSLEALSLGFRKMQETANGFYRKTQEDTKEG